MKLKQLPSDFIVEEIPSQQFSSEKDVHTIFLLEKQEIDTFDAIRLLAQKLHISLFEIGYAGLKDRHAVARQYISIPSRYNVKDVTVENVRIRFVGYAKEKIKIGDLNGNRFTITVRDIASNELDFMMKRAETIPLCGVPNYFDSQRFGSVIGHEFIGKLIIQKNYEKAVKQFLTAYQKSEPKKIKDEKRRILSQWNNLDGLLLRNKVFAKVVSEYGKTKSWLASYKKIPAHLREMFVNAYQSYLWNESVKELLKNCVEKKKLYPVEYAAGSLLFYNSLSKDEQAKIPLTFQTVSPTVVLTADEKKIVDKIFSKQGITLGELDIEKETSNFFKSRPRQIIVIPEDFLISNPIVDELNTKGNNERYKTTISFSLSKGSYATIVTKRLFGH